MAAVSLFGMSFATLIPAWAVQILHGDSRINGFLQSARGIGALTARAVDCLLRPQAPQGKDDNGGKLLFPFMLVLFSFTRILPLSLLAILAVGAANIAVNNLANALVQTLTPDAVRGQGHEHLHAGVLRLHADRGAPGWFLRHRPGGAAHASRSAPRGRSCAPWPWRSSSRPCGGSD